MAKRRMKRPEIEQPPDPSIRHIPLTQGQVAIVNAADYERIMQWNWYAHWSPSTGTFYAKRNVWQENGKQTPLGMHTAILQPSEGKVADHISGDTLDNRRANLREADASQSAANRQLMKHNQLRVKGVRAHGNKFQARIRVNGKSIHLGLFATVEEAAKAYAEAAENLHGEFRRLR